MTLARIAAQQAALDHEAHASIDQDEAKGSIPKPRPRAGEGVHLAGGCKGLNPLADHRFTKKAQASGEEQNAQLGFDVPADFLNSHKSNGGR